MGFLDSLFNNAKSAIRSDVNKSVNNAVNNAAKNVGNAVTNAATHTKKTFTFQTLPMSVAELTSDSNYNMKDQFAVSALAVVALNAYGSDRETGIAMLNALKGPQPLSEREKQFIRDRFQDGKDYVPRSYFRGAVPTNDYTPSQPYTIDVEEMAHSRDTINEGYIKMFLQSGGADSPRYMVLRTKPSTGEWFVWDVAGLLPDIRIPSSKDAWA